MTSSGKTRGLAMAAVGAVTLGLLPFAMSGSAYAASLSDQLLSPQAGGTISTLNDGVNTSIHLLAADSADVQVQFQLSTDAGTTWSDIGSAVHVSSGVADTEWTPGTSDAVAMATAATGALEIQAVGENAAGDPQGVVGTAANLTYDPSAPTVNIGTALGASVGVFQAPDGSGDFGVISGTTSDSSVDVNLLGSGNLTSAGLGTPSHGISSWTGAVDFSGYVWDSTAPIVNSAAVQATANTGGTSDASVVELYKQTITTVTADAMPPNVQSGNTADIVVTVLDQNGKPIDGAHVYQADDNTVQDVTGADGTATFSGYAAGTYSFVVDATSDYGSYNPASDFKVSATVTQYTAVPTTLTASSSLPSAFDYSEYSAGDMAAVLDDQNGNPIAGATVLFHQSFVSFDGTNKDERDYSVTTNSSGKAKIPFGSNEIAAPGTYKITSYVEMNGKPGQQSGDLAGNTLTFKAGTAQVAFDAGTYTQLQSGAVSTVTGTVALEDGTALTSRDVTLTLSGTSTSGTADAILAKQADQPAGTTRNGALSATATTDGSGAFAVAINDPALSPVDNELGVALDASSISQSAPTLTIDFIADMTPATIAASTINDDTLGIGVGGPTPGDPVDVAMTVKNAGGDTLADVPVTLTVDHGYFPKVNKSGDFVPATMPTSASDLVGDWASDGTSITVKTNDSGVAEFPVAIGRDSAFDTDGTLTMKVSASAGAASKNYGVDFSTQDALNGSSVDFVLAPHQSALSALPNVRFDSTDVFYNMVATDQFGNPVPASLSGFSQSGQGDYDWNCSFSHFGFPGVPADSCADGQVYFYDYYAPGAENAQVSWSSAPELTWADADGSKAGFQYGYGDWTSGSQSLTGSLALNWYTVDAANSTITLANDTSNNMADVGTTVTEKVTAIDQYGVPINCADVQFLRSGPSGNGSVSDCTNANGVLTYNFMGTTAGTANISAVVSVNGIQVAKLYDSVTFKNAVSAALKGHSKGTLDVLKVRTSPADTGATVVFKRGHHKIGKALVNSHGVAKLKVTDKNGNKLSRYHAKVKPTLISFGARTNGIRIR